MGSESYSNGSTHSTETSFSMDTAYKADTTYKAADSAPSHAETEMPTPGPAPTPPPAPAPTPPPVPASSSTVVDETASPIDFDALARTSMRRKEMGEAAVRIAGRLAHTELLQEGSSAADATSEADHLLTLLGEYLTAAGFERPELHAKLAGQSIVVDLVGPGKRTV
ncbi:MAG: hypothetical protein GX610_11020 [Rhodococcus sp.]|nr:hypothetical protein [Rhodococcus sp. (in: high G+C Gram-positive bacteria)]